MTNSLSSNLINYEVILDEACILISSWYIIIFYIQGKITDDTFGSSGFYQLDDSLTLCLTYMKLVTSIPIIKKGDTVVIHGAHRLRVRDKFLILICGRGNLVNR